LLNLIVYVFTDPFRLLVYFSKFGQVPKSEQRQSKIPLFFLAILCASMAFCSNVATLNIAMWSNTRCARFL